MDLEQKRIDTMAEIVGSEIESSETLTFSFDTGNEITPPSPDQENTKDDFKVDETGIVADTTKAVRKPDETIEASFDELNNGTFGNEKTVDEIETEDETFKFNDNEEGKVEVEVEEGAGEKEAVEEETVESKLLKRIEELEANQKKSMNDKDFEAKYSKENMVMPNVSEYDYAVLGKEIAEDGSLSEETYKSLEEKGYSKSVVNNHIEQTLKQAESNTEQPIVKTQDVVKSEFAKELSIDSTGLDNLINDVKKVFSPEQLSKFDNDDAKTQIITLQKFQMQKMQHEQKLKSKQLVKGNNTKTSDLKGIDSISTQEAGNNFKKAMAAGDERAMTYWNAVLDKKGVSLSL